MNLDAPSPLKWPVDFSEYPRGSIIPAEVIEEAFGVPQSANTYWAMMLKMKSLWQQWFIENGHGPVSVAMQGANLKSMQDGPEQWSYSRRTSRKGLRAFMKAHLEQCAVTPSLLSQEDQRRHYRELERTSKIAQLVRPRKPLPDLPPLLE